jgi:hypothetical protein
VTAHVKVVEQKWSRVVKMYLMFSMRSMYLMLAIHRPFWINSFKS